MKKLKLNLKQNNFKFIKEMPRNCYIFPNYVNKTFKIYNGKVYLKLKIKEEMVGFKFGEFFPTRKTFFFKKKKK